MIKRSILLLLFASLVVAGCGGALERRKQQVTVGITPNQEVTLEPGQRIGLSASAKAIDEPLTSMRWSIEAVSTPTQGPQPTIANANCATATLTIKDKDGIGRCSAELSVPASAEPMTWRIAVQAEAQSKGSASAAFVLKVVAPARDTGNFRVEVPALVTTDAAGNPLVSNQLVSITANALSDKTVSGLSYQWTQTGGPNAVLAGATSARLQFVPRSAGEYQFRVTASGSIDGRAEQVSAEVLVIVEDSDRVDELVVFAGNAQSVASGDLVSLTGQASYSGSAVTNPTYVWTQVAGPAVTLANPTSATPTFFAPIVVDDVELVFDLQVNALVGGRTLSGNSRTVVRVEP